MQVQKNGLAKNIKSENDENIWRKAGCFVNLAEIETGELTEIRGCGIFSLSNIRDKKQRRFSQEEERLCSFFKKRGGSEHETEGYRTHR